MKDDSDSAVVWHGTRPDQAGFLKSLLEAEGIPCEMLGANQSTQRMFSGGTAFGLRLMVPASREADAAALIARHESGLQEAPTAPGGADWVEAYRAPSVEDARFMAVLLGERGVACALETGEEDEAGLVPTLLRVPPDQEKEAVAAITEHLEERGLSPDEAAGAGPEGGPGCPNCGEPAPRAQGEACAECGYSVRPAPSRPLSSFGRAFPDAPSCCPECCAPSTLASGACPDCGVALEPAEPGAPVCPEGLHMLVKGEAPGWVCPGCRAAWLEA
jgi:hypothetical protein